MSLSLLADDATLTAVNIGNTSVIDAFGSYTATTIDTSYSIPVEGLTDTSVVVAQLASADSGSARVLSAVAGTNTITITLNKTPSSAHTYSYVVLKF